MAVMRVEKSTNYTVMSNRHLDDTRLSLKAIGLLSKILRLPDDWDYTLEGLAHICKEGKDAIRSAIVELEQAGYIERRQTHAADGSFAGNEYIVHEAPFDADATPSSDNPTTVSPSSGNPSTDNPSTENPTQPNTISTKYLDTNTPLTPQRGRRAPKKEQGREPTWKPERFEAFWRYYPRGESKRTAIAAWDKLKPDDALIDDIARALKRQMASEEWQRGVGIPYAATYLNQRRWEDESHAPAEQPAEGGGLPLWT